MVLAELAVAHWEELSDGNHWHQIGLLHSLPVLLTIIDRYLSNNPIRHGDNSGDISIRKFVEMCFEIWGTTTDICWQGAWFNVTTCIRRPARELLSRYFPWSLTGA